MSKSTITLPSRKSEAISLITPEFKGSDFNTLIFPEWSDQALNDETWDSGKHSLKTSRESASVSQTHSIKTTSPPLPFRDKHSYTLPMSIPVFKWKKPEVLFHGKTLVIYKESSYSNYANFIDGSRHLLQSQFMRFFISSIGSLEHMGYTSPWPMEGTSADFTPNTLNEPWKPWHHIYSLCKAGKGQKHRPLVNKMGKYILRLFWMGSWRQIIIDDFLPVDRQNHILLPTVEKFEEPFDSHTASTLMGEYKAKNDIEHDVIELWPFLLCKGLLKIANLTWSERREIVDFNIVHSLTGWVCQKLNTINLNPNELWDIVVAYTEHYKWPDDNLITKGSILSEKSTVKLRKEKPKKGEGKASFQASKADTIPFCVLLQVSDMRGLQGYPNDKIPSIAPCWSHLFLVSKIRNIPLEKPEYKPVIERWKRFRWIEWAIANGKYSEEQASLKILQMVDFFKHVNDHVIYPDVSLPQVKVSTRNSAESFKSSKKDKKTSSEYSRESKGTKKDKLETVSFHQPPDPSFWADFLTLSPYIEHALIFFRPAMFNNYYVVTDMQENPENPRDTKPDCVQKRLIWPYDLKGNRNEPVYVFFDSLDYQTLIVCLSHSGNREILEQKCLLVHCDLTSLWQKKFSFQDRTKLRTHANIMFEKYDWETDTYGDLCVGLYTRGMQALVISISPGRTIMRFWVCSSSSYSVDLLSDYAFEIGTMEYILECMPAESERFQQMCFDFGSSFGNLVKSFGMEGYIDNVRAFYKSYRPEVHISKVDCQTLDDEMLKELESIVKQQYPDCGEAMFALRVLFLKPGLGIDCRSKKNKNDRKISIHIKVDKEKKSAVSDQPLWDDMECFSDQYLSSSSSEDEIKIEKTRERAACTIQTFFKMVYTQSLRSCQDPSNSNYGQVFETLKKIYKDVFNVDNCISVIPGLFRKLLFRNEKLTGFLERFSCHKDLHSVVNCQCLTETISCKENSWVMMGRYVFYVNSPYEEPVKICLFSTLENYVLRVFNNDTEKEILKCVNETLVDKYSSNANGYTILAYGWNKNSQTVKFKINLVTLKKADIPPLIIPAFNQSVLQLADVYHHNVNNVVGKYKLGISQDTALSLRLSCTYPKAILKLRCLDGDRNVIKEIVGKQNIIMPLVQLKCEDDNKKGSGLNRKKSRSITNTTTKSNTSRKKSFSDKVSVGTRTSRASKTSRTSVSLADVIRKPCLKSIYLVEAYVLKESWPLTNHEWLESGKLTSRTLLGGETSSKALLKKMSDITKSCAKADYDTLPNPKWRLQVIHNAENPVVLKFDNTRATEIGNTKLAWYEDKTRYSVSKKLRDDYLKSFIAEEQSAHTHDSLMSEPDNSDNALTLFNDYPPQITHFSNISLSSFSITKTPANSPNIASEESLSRTRIKPQSSSVRKLPPLDYDVYAYQYNLNGSFLSLQGNASMEDDDTFNQSGSFSQEESIKSEVSGFVKKPEDFQKDVEDMEKAMEDFWLYHDEYINDMLAFRNNTLNTSFALENWFDGIRTDSTNLIGQAYRMRATFIDILEEYEKELKAYEKLSEEIVTKTISNEAQSSKTKKKGGSKTNRSKL